VIFLAATTSLTEEDLLSWGWRIPFFCSAPGSQLTAARS
jgi:hypothetical protein